MALTAPSWLTDVGEFFGQADAAVAAGQDVLKDVNGFFQTAVAPATNVRQLTAPAGNPPPPVDAPREQGTSEAGGGGGMLDQLAESFGVSKGLLMGGVVALVLGLGFLIFRRRG